MTASVIPAPEGDDFDGHRRSVAIFYVLAAPRQTTQAIHTRRASAAAEWQQRRENTMAARLWPSSPAAARKRWPQDPAKSAVMAMDKATALKRARLRRSIDLVYARADMGAGLDQSGSGRRCTTVGLFIAGSPATKGSASI